jgi:hypothetical protein
MAALVDTSMPEITRQISRESEVLEPDVMVKSKPRPVANLMQQQQQQQQNGVEENGEPEPEEEEEIEPDVIVKSKPRPLLVDLLQDEDRPVGPLGGPPRRTMEEPPSGGHVRLHQQQSQTLSPTSPTTTMNQTSSEVRQKKANGDIGGRGGGGGEREKQVAPSLAVAETIDQVTVNRKEVEFEDSTALLLRRYTDARSGRQGHIPITSTGELGGGSVSLKETFRIAGRSCTVQLEEDYISWAPNGKKDGKLHKKHTPQSVICSLTACIHVCAWYIM